MKTLKTRKAAGIAPLADEHLTHVTGGHAAGHAVQVPGAAAPKIFELVATGKARGLHAAMVR